MDFNMMGGVNLAVYNQIATMRFKLDSYIRQASIAKSQINKGLIRSFDSLKKIGVGRKINITI